MSKSIIKIGTIFLVFFLIIGCPDPSNTIIIDDPIAKSFWGNWVRMDGVNELWYFSDSQVTIGSTVYDASTSSSDHSTILSGYTITYKTANMLTVKPDSSLEFYLFRKSGASAQISGGVLVSDSYSGRSVSSVRGLGGVGGIDVILENIDNPSNVIEATTDADGNLIFDEVIIDDEYTLEILGEPDITITPEFDGEDIGFITLNNADQNFKVSYQLSSGDHWGYHYMDQSYNLTLRITNFGTADMLSADYQVTVPSGMSMSGDSLQNILGTVQANGGVKELDYSISVNSFTEDYEDFDISIEITSVYGDQWSDIVQLRFFRETMSINVRSESNEVQGIVISPDNRSFPFKTSYKSGSIALPARVSGYILALSGADYESETKYALRINETPLVNGSSLISATINEPNNDETQGIPALPGRDYLGYLGFSDLDFYQIYNAITGTVLIVSGDDPTNDTTPTWSWNSPSGAVGYRYSFTDGSGWVPISANRYTPSSSLSDGVYTLYVQAEDALGNWSSSGSNTIEVDTIAPEAPIISGVTPAPSLSPTWTWDTPSGAVGYRFSLTDGIGWTTSSVNQYTKTVLEYGLYTLYVQAVDATGNWSNSGNKTIQAGIGLNYAGGIIFYLDGSSGGLVCAGNDQGQNIEWGGFDLSGGTEVGTTRTAVGTGANNSEAIILSYGNVSPDGNSNYAAKLCDGLVLNGYADWFLPSIDELYLMYQNLRLKGLGSFTRDFYWSSSEYNSDQAWNLNFYYSDELPFEKYKWWDEHIRAVRAF